MCAAPLLGQEGSSPAPIRNNPAGAVSGESERDLLAQEALPGAAAGEDPAELDGVDGDLLAAVALRERAAGGTGELSVNGWPWRRAHSATTSATMRPSCSAVSSIGLPVAGRCRPGASTVSRVRMTSSR